MNPFEYLTSINQTKQNMMRGTENDDLAENEYDAWLTNRGLSYFQDTIMFSNEMNSNHHLDKKLQYEFLLNIIRPKKRFSKWFKKDENENFSAVQEYFGYSHEKTLAALNVLNDDQIEIIKTRIEKGG